MGRLSRRLLISTSLVAMATLLGPLAGGPASACTLTGTLYLCGQGDFYSIGGALDDMSIEFLPGPTNLVSAGPGVIGIENSITSGLGTQQSIRLGDHGVSFRPVGERSSAIGIFAQSVQKPVDALLTGRMDVESSASIRSTVYVGASGNATVDTSGRIKSTGELANGLHVHAWHGNVDVRSSAAISTSGDGASGVLVDRIAPGTPVGLDVNGVLYNRETAPRFDDPPPGSVMFAPITRGSVDVRLTGPIHVEGFDYRPDPKQPNVPASGVIVRNQAGDVNLTVGDLTMGSETRAPSSVGILANALDGNVTVDLTGNLKMYGSGIGIYAVAPNGVATINAPNPIFIDQGAATFIHTESGSFKIAAGDVTMTSFNADAGIYSTRPRVFMMQQYGDALSTITTGAIDVSTFNSDAFLGNVRNADINFKSITMSGNQAKGVFMSGEEIEPGMEITSRLSVNGPISQTGSRAWGVYYRMLDATINSNITQTGSNSIGIYADGLGSAPILLHSTGNITSSGDGSTGISGQQLLFGSDPNAFMRIRSDGAITMTGQNATGALIDNYMTSEEAERIFGSSEYAGSAFVSATFNGDVRSTGGGGRAIDVSGDDITLNLSGVTLGGSNSSKRTGAGVIALAYNDIMINNTGSLSSMNLAALDAYSDTGAVTLINSGQIAGTVLLDAATDARFQNIGQFWTAGLTTSPGGMLQNSGFVGVLGAPAGSMDVRLAADVVSSGTISLKNGVAGDQLTIGDANMNLRLRQAGRTYTGTGDATLEVDAMLTNDGAADRLNLTGATSGATRIAVSNLARGATTVTPTFIPVVTGAAGASSDAFSLQGGVVASGLTDWALEQRGDTFGIASRVNATRAGDAARAGSRMLDVFNLAMPPDVAGVGGGGGASSSAILNFAPSSSAPRGFPRAMANFDANASTNAAIAEASRGATPIVHLGAIHQRARTVGDQTSASAIYGGLDVVWGALKGPAPRVTAGAFMGYSSGVSDMAGASRVVTDAKSFGARLRFDADGWFAGAGARIGVGDIKYTLPGAQGRGEILFSGLDAYIGRRFDIGSNWYVQPTLLTTYAKASSDTFNVGGAPMQIRASQWRSGGEARLGRDGLLIGSTGWTMDAYVSAGVWRGVSDGATQFATLTLAPPSNGAIWTYGGGLVAKAPGEALTLRLGALGQAGGVRSFTLFGGVTVPFGG